MSKPLDIQVGEEYVPTREFAARISEIEGQINRRIETNLRELQELRAYFNAILTEKDRAVEMANSERGKAATALATALAKTISDGDDHLREHVANQVRQIEAALIAAQLLSSEQIDNLSSQVKAVEQRSHMRHEQMREQLASRFQYTETAVAKADTATEKRFESVNEWRAQSADRERSQADERAKLQTSFMLKEVAETQIEQLRHNSESRYDVLRETIATLIGRVDGIIGENQGAKAQRTESRAMTTQQMGFTMAGLTIIWIIVAIVGVLVATSH